MTRILSSNFNPPVYISILFIPSDKCCAKVISNTDYSVEYTNDSSIYQELRIKFKVPEDIEYFYLYTENGIKYFLKELDSEITYFIIPVNIYNPDYYIFLVTISNLLNNRWTLVSETIDIEIIFGNVNSVKEKNSKTIIVIQDKEIENAIRYAFNAPGDTYKINIESKMEKEYILTIFTPPLVKHLLGTIAFNGGIPSPYSLQSNLNVEISVDGKEEKIFLNEELLYKIEELVDPYSDLKSWYINDQLVPDEMNTGEVLEELLEEWM